MPNKLTTKDINDLLHKSNPKFNLIEGTYKGTTQRLGVHCGACGSGFNPTFSTCRRLILQCPECARRGRVRDACEKLSKIDHGNYILVDPDSYNNVNELVTVKHLKCGRTFRVSLTSMFQKPLKGRKHSARCPYCGRNHKIGEEEALDRLKSTTWKLISNYSGWNDQATFECKKCGYINKISFREAARRNVCPHCNPVKKLSEQDYKNKLEDVWGNRIILIGKYTLGKNKSLFHCNNCGHDFKKRASDLIYGYHTGCPYCASSHLETNTVRVFKKMGINYKYQVRFKGLVDTQYLSYDFYLDDYNLLIELDGDQHFKPFKRFGGIKRFHKQQYHDQLKENYAKDNGYNLLRISYALRNDLDRVYKKYLPKFSKDTCKVIKVGEDYKLLKDA